MTDLIAFICICVTVCIVCKSAKRRSYTPIALTGYLEAVEVVVWAPAVDAVAAAVAAVVVVISHTKFSDAFGNG
jgi:hypothetical protein